MVVAGHAEVLALIERLVIEYSGAFAAGSIITAVVRSRLRLIGERHSAAPTVEFLEQVVRRELTHELARTRTMPIVHDVEARPSAAGQ